MAMIVKFSAVSKIFFGEENQDPLFMNSQKTPLRP